MIVGRPPKRQRALTESLQSPIKARCLTSQATLLTSTRFSSCIAGSAKYKAKTLDVPPLNLLPSFHEVSYSICFVQGGCGAVDNEPGGSRGVC